MYYFFRQLPPAPPLESGLDSLFVLASSGQIEGVHSLRLALQRPHVLPLSPRTLAITRVNKLKLPV